VAQEAARRRVGYHGALVADHRVVDARRLEVRPDAAEHAAGRDEHADAGVAGRGDRGARPGPELTVGPEERAVEVAGEDVDLAREPGR
jgi:hypothetical protein